MSNSLRGGENRAAPAALGKAEATSPYVNAAADRVAKREAHIKAHIDGLRELGMSESFLLDEESALRAGMQNVAVVDLILSNCGLRI